MFLIKDKRVLLLICGLAVTAINSEESPFGASKGTIIELPMLKSDGKESGYAHVFSELSVSTTMVRSDQEDEDSDTATAIKVTVTNISASDVFVFMDLKDSCRVTTVVDGAWEVSSALRIGMPENHYPLKLLKANGVGNSRPTALNVYQDVIPLIKPVFLSELDRAYVTVTIKGFIRDSGKEFVYKEKVELDGLREVGSNNGVRVSR